MGKANYFRIKPWEELTFTDDYMFKLVLRKHEHICRRLLETILEVKIGRIEYLETEKTSDPEYEGHGVRFDVYLKDEQNTVYNIEMQVRNPGDVEVAKRMRYYQAAIDVADLPSGVDYRHLHNTFIIFICPFAFLQGERVFYTFRYRCVQDMSIQLPDETTKIVIATQGKITPDTPKALIPLISYINNREIRDDFTQEIENVIEYEKRFETERVGYMNYEITLNEAKAYGFDLGYDSGYNSGRTEGYDSGRVDGYNYGRSEGYDSGRADGFSAGKLQEIRSLISAGLLSLADIKASGRYTDEELAAIQNPKN